MRTCPACKTPEDAAALASRTAPPPSGHTEHDATSRPERILAQALVPPRNARAALSCQGMCRRVRRAAPRRGSSIRAHAFHSPDQPPPRRAPARPNRTPRTPRNATPPHRTPRAERPNRTHRHGTPNRHAPQRTATARTARHHPRHPARSAPHQHPNPAQRRPRDEHTARPARPATNTTTRNATPRAERRRAQRGRPPRTARNEPAPRHHCDHTGHSARHDSTTHTPNAQTITTAPRAERREAPTRTPRHAPNDPHGTHPPSACARRIFSTGRARCSLPAFVHCFPFQLAPRRSSPACRSSSVPRLSPVRCPPFVGPGALSRGDAGGRGRRFTCERRTRLRSSPCCASARHRRRWTGRARERPPRLDGSSPSRAVR